MAMKVIITHINIKNGCKLPKSYREAMKPIIIKAAVRKVLGPIYKMVKVIFSVQRMIHIKRAPPQ